MTEPTTAPAGTMPPPRSQVPPPSPQPQNSSETPQASSTPTPGNGESTPQPVLKAAGVWGTVATLLITIVGVLVAMGVLSATEADAIRESVGVITTNIVPVGVALVGVCTLVSGIVSHLVTAFAARRHVVPTNSDAFVVTPKARR